MSEPLYIRVHGSDNVAVVANVGGLPAASRFSCGLELIEHVPQGHKVALVDLPEGTPIRRYDVTIGYALKNVPAGSWVNENLLRMPEARSLDDLPIASVKSQPPPPLEEFSFEGFRNPDASAGTRNILAITTTVQCVSGVVDFAVRRIREELLPRFPNVDDVVGLEHTYGCGVAIDAPDAHVPIRTLRNISLNPNFGGEVMVVSLGCEKLQPNRLLPPGTIPIVDELSVADVGENAAPTLDVVCLQDDHHVGFMSMIESIVSRAEAHLERLNARRRTKCPASDLVVGVQCGGSDAFSGITANPAVGFAADLLVRAGATVTFSEVTEVRDGIDQLTARAASPEVAEAMIREMAWYDAYLERGGVDRSANTTRGTGHQGGHPRRSRPTVARPHGPERRPHRHRRSHDRGCRVGAVSAHARGRQRARDLGRALESAQCPHPVQPGASDLSGRTDLIRNTEMLRLVLPRRPLPVDVIHECLQTARTEHDLASSGAQPVHIFPGEAKRGGQMLHCLRTLLVRMLVEIHLHKIDLEVITSLGAFAGHCPLRATPADQLTGDIVESQPEQCQGIEAVLFQGDRARDADGIGQGQIRVGLLELNAHLRLGIHHDQQHPRDVGHTHDFGEFPRAARQGQPVQERSHTEIVR